jgi:bifunctional UDP-N-acetylglucosamine pyrophosphorylase/glucosamine-1-phosphate N-acetyltransferase
MTGTSSENTITIVLAAGKGTRMNTSRPKVLQELLGRPLIHHVMDTANETGSGRTLVVVGHGADEVKDAVKKQYAGTGFVLQERQLGTGHAVMQCLGHLEEHTGSVLILSGDVPLLPASSLAALLAKLETHGADLAVLTGELKDPTGYGRMIRDAEGGLLSIVEHRDLAPGQEAVREVNLGIYAIRAQFLVNEIKTLSTGNAQGEYYLTDLVQMASAGNGAVSVCLDDPGEAMGINTLMELAAMEKNARMKKVEELMAKGVRIMDPENTWIDEQVTVEADTVISPMVSITGKSSVGAGSSIGQGSVITDSVIGSGVTIRPYCVIGQATVRDNAAVGPFAHLRPEADIGTDGRVGNFVEIKKSVLGPGSKVNHLTYVGDSELGKDVNIGAGCVTCNYDGFSKHRTVVEDGAFVGSGTMMVAPVTVGKGALVAAGTTLTRDVPEDSLALGRARQENKEGYAKSWREKARSKKEGGKS